MFKKRRSFLGFLGFLGFLSLRYFASHDPADLCWLAFFAYFSFFVMAKISIDKPDERYYEDVKTAKAFTLDIVLYEVLALFLLFLLLPASRPFMGLGISAVFATAMLVYAVKLYRLEEG